MKRDSILSMMMIGVGTTAITLTVPATANAQSGSAAAQPKPDAEPSEIVVTGERANRFGTDVVQSGSFRNAKVLDVPMTVSVIPDAVLKSQQAVDLIDALRNTAGVSMSSVGPSTYNNVTIRGIAVDTRSSYKLDGTLNILSSTAFPLEDKDRVEVLKGASAIYYGFSPPSGIVNLVMKRPTSQFSLSVRGFGDSNGGAGGHIDIGDTMGIFGYRINALGAHQDTGVDFAAGTRYMLSGTFDLKPTSKLTISADLEWFKKNIVEPAVFAIPNGATRIPDLAFLDPRTNLGGLDWDNNKTEEFNALVKGVYKFSKDWDVTAYYGRSHLSRFRYNPQFSPGRGATASATPSVASYLAAIDPGSPTFGQGVMRYGANIQTAGYENIGYSAELHGKITSGDISNNVLIGASRSLRSLAGSPANPRSSFFSSFLNPVGVANPNAGLGTRPVPTAVDDKGVYVFDDLGYRDILHLTGGMRATDYKNGGSTNSSTKQPYRVKPVAWSGGAVFKPVKWASIYGTYIQGLEENGVPAALDDNAFDTLPPISSTLYEGGVKLEPMSNLLIQTAYFDIKRENALSERIIDPVAGTQHAFADATQTYRGFEASVSGYVTKDLALNANITFLTARTFQALNPASVKKRPAGTPNNTWSVSGEYTLSWLDPGLKVSAGVYHTSNQAMDDTDNVFVPSFTTFDLGASYEFQWHDHKVTARVNGQNITNKRYWAAVGGSLLAEGLPAVVKFSLAFSY